MLHFQLKFIQMFPNMIKNVYIPNMLNNVYTYPKYGKFNLKPPKFR